MEIVPYTVVEVPEEDITLRYAKLVTRTGLSAELKVESYGVQILMERKGDVIKEKERLNLSVEENEADRLLELLSRHTVTPGTLNDVLEDLAYKG